MSSKSAEYCREPRRRQEIRARGANGIDYVEVSDDHRTLTVFFLNRITMEIEPANVVISGGSRVRHISVTGVQLRNADEDGGDNCMDVAIDRAGDTSIYRLSLVALDGNGGPTGEPLPGIDLRYAGADFTFRFGEATEIDCCQPQVRAPAILPAPDINYLARDFQSFRKLMLDRLAVTVPQWQEQHVPDTGVALVEVLAYVADHLCYYQDAVATEACLATARQRISVRRHARLVDYVMHEGCNARAWVFVETATDTSIDPDTVHFVAGYMSDSPIEKSVLSPGDISLEICGQLAAFEPMSAAQLYTAHNRIDFYTWQDLHCCLPVGATSATLCDVSKNLVPVYAEAKPQLGAQEKRSSRKRSTKHAEEPAAYGAPPGAKAPPPAEERKLHLQPGDVLLLEETRQGHEDHGPAPDPAHRHLVRLTEVKPGSDPLTGELVLEVAWALEDALPFPLCLSNVNADGDGVVGVARGNVVLADHGDWTAQGARVRDEHLPLPMAGAKFRPTLEAAFLTFFRPLTPPLPAARQLVSDPRAAVPKLTLVSIPMLDDETPLFTFADLEDPAPLAARIDAGQDRASRAVSDRLAVARRASKDSSRDPSGDLNQQLRALLRTWSPQPDLLSSNGDDLHFVVEMDNDGFAHLRFGDGKNGRAPEVGEQFVATYRVGIGTNGNVGAETITHVVTTRSDLVLKPRNPLAATGGIDPELIAHVKLVAPAACKNEIVRAVKADDYARLAERNPRVERAACELQWAGTRYEAHVAIDPAGTEALDPALLRQIQADLYRYRRIGHDVVVVPPTYVPIDIAMTVTVSEGYAAGHLQTELLNVFSDRRWADGRLGFFHPDNLSFGEPIYSSKLVTAAQDVEGVESVVVTRLQRRFEPPNRELESGVLPFGPLEVARLGHDRASPEAGRFVLTLRGGR